MITFKNSFLKLGYQKAFTISNLKKEKEKKKELKYKVS